jgi:hypothetical protein
MIDHPFVTMQVHEDMVLHRYSFMGNPSLPNSESPNEFLFGSLTMDESREGKRFINELKELNPSVQFFLVHVRRCEQVVSNGGCVFLPTDIISWCEV